MIKAIETKYKGYRFRSRLEARYAVLFDSLKIKWDYEPEGFNFGGGEYYLPDFLITQKCFDVDISNWVEIKPFDPSEEEFKKAAILSRETKRKILILCGTPGEQRTFVHYSNQKDNGFKLIDDPLYALVLTAFPGAIKIGWSLANSIEYAIEDAKSAHFEFGEKH